MKPIVAVFVFVALVLVVWNAGAWAQSDLPPPPEVLSNDDVVVMALNHPTVKDANPEITKQVSGRRFDGTGLWMGFEDQLNPDGRRDEAVVMFSLIQAKCKLDPGARQGLERIAGFERVRAEGVVAWGDAPKRYFVLSPCRITKLN